MHQGLRAFAVATALIVAPAGASAETGPEAPNGCEWRADGALFCAAPDGQMAKTPHSPDLDAQTVAKARAGEVEAMVNLALFYGYGEPPRDTERMLEWFGKAAAKGDRLAMFDLGAIYFNGRGVEADKAQALTWFKGAAEAGDIRAMAQVGRMYAAGQGVPQDAAVAFEWFRKAAQGGCPCGMLELARAYDEGLGVDRNPAEAARWRTLAQGVGQWARLPTADELQQAYPPEAAAADVTGEVMLSCAIAADDGLTNCVVKSETPQGWGFGEAALSLQGRLRQKPGLPPGREVRAPVVFQLSGWDASPRQSQKCAAYAQVLLEGEPLPAMANWFARYWIARERYLTKTDAAIDPERHAELVEKATARLAANKERGLFGAVPACNLDR